MNKFISLVLCLLMVFSPAVFAAPTAMPVEDAQEINVADLQEEAALTADNPVKTTAPGLNSLTGKPGALDFEDLTDTQLKMIFSGPNGAAVSSSLKVAENPLKAGNNTSDKVLTLKTAYTNVAGSTEQYYPNFYVAFPNAIEVDRPVFISIKYHRTNTGTANTDYNPAATYLWLLKNGSGSNKILEKHQSIVGSAWETYAQDTSLKCTSGTSTSDMTSMTFQTNFYASDKVQTNYYFDDIAVIPAYKVTYHNGTSTYKTEYIKCNLSGPIGGNVYTVSEDGPSSDDGKIFLGWSTTDGGAAVSSVTLANEDIDLYPVYGNNPLEAVATYDFNDNTTQGFGQWGDLTLTAANGALSVNRSKSSHNALTTPSLNLDTRLARYAKIVLKSTNGTTTSLTSYFIRTIDSGISEDRTVSVTLDTTNTGWQTVYLPLCENVNKNYNGILKQLQINGIAVGDTLLIDEISFVANKPVAFWDFNDGTTQGWKGNGNIAVEATGTDLKVVKSGGGTHSFEPTGISFTAGQIKNIVVKYKDNSSSTFMKIYWNGKRDGVTLGIAESRTFKMPMVAGDTANTQYKTLIYNLDDNEDFTTTDITTMLWQISNEGTAYIDEIAFYGDFALTEHAPSAVFDFETDALNWSKFGSLSESFDGSAWNITRNTSSTDNSAGLYSPTKFTIDPAYAKQMVIRLKNTSTATKLEGYWSTAEASGFSASRLKNLTVPANMASYKNVVIDLTQFTDWNGTRLMFGIKPDGGTFSIDKISFYEDYDPAVSDQDEPTLALNVSATSITTEGGKVTITPEVTGMPVDTVSYVADNNNALVTKNADGSLTLTGKMNGNITITAISDYDPTMQETVTISISGQSEKVAYYDANVVMLGNSILHHGPSSSLGWYGDWGMAASSQDKDYVHQLLSLLSTKYGNLDYFETNFADFERSIKPQDGVDYTSALSSVRSQIESIDNPPEIITVQMGENVSTSPSKDQYKAAVEQLISLLNELAPNAQIIVCSSFWKSQYTIDGMREIAAAHDNIRFVDLSVLDSTTYMAYDSFSDPGVGHHPGDLGMKRIAELIYDQLRISLTENLKPEYTVYPTTLEITASDNKITTAYGKLQLGVTVNPTEALAEARWSVDNESVATVDENGLVTAKNDGTVTVTAVSKIAENVQDTFTIEVSGQTKAYTLTYAAGNYQGVTGLPEANTLAKDNVTVSKVVPSLQYSIFEGWTLNKETKELVGETIYVSDNVTLYPVFRPALTWKFDRFEGSGDGDFYEGIATNGFNKRVENGIFQALQTYNVLNFTSQPLNVTDADKFVVRVQNTAKQADTEFKVIFKTASGDHTKTLPVTTTEFTTYVFDVSDITDTITGFEIYPTNVDCAVNIDEMAFVTGETKTVTFNANTTGTVTGIPSVQTAVTNTFNVPADVPVRDGYRFVGWAKSADSILPLSKVDLTSTNTTLYAIWDRVTHWDFSSDDEFGVYYSKNPAAHIVDGTLNESYAGSSASMVTLSKNGIDTSVHKNFEIRIKYKVTNSSQYVFNIYYHPSSLSDWSESTKATYTSDVAETDGFITASIDISAVPNKGQNWNSNILKFRLDPMTGRYGEYWIDYVRFTEADAENVFVIREGMTEKASAIPYSNVVLNGGTLVVDEACSLTNLAIAKGDVEFNAPLKITGKLEIAEDMPYTSYDVAAQLAGDNKVVLSGDNAVIEDVSAGKYLVKLSGDSVYAHNSFGYSESSIVKITKDGTVAADNSGMTLLTMDMREIRTEAPQGMRFFVQANHSLKNFAETPANFGQVKEYGFVVARADKMPDGMPTLADVEAGIAVKGVAFTTSKSYIYDIDDELGIDYITCVLHGVPMNKTALTTQLVMVPYVSINNGSSLETVYGQSISGSVYDIALEVDSDDAFTKEVIELCK